MSVLLLSYLYNPAVMLVLSWNLIKRYGLEDLRNTRQKYAIFSFFFSFCLFVGCLFFFFARYTFCHYRQSRAW